MTPALGLARRTAADDWREKEEEEEALIARRRHSSSEANNLSRSMAPATSALFLLPFACLRMMRSDFSALSILGLGNS